MRPTLSPPAEQAPAAMADSSIRPEIRLSRPMTRRGRSSPPSAVMAARPMANASSGVSSRFATPRTPSVPKSLVTGESYGARPRPLSLRVLGGLPGLLQPVLATLFLPGVPGEEPFLFQGAPEGGVELDEGPGDAVAEGPGLAGDTATLEPGHHVDLLLLARGPQGRRGQDPLGPGREVLLERAPVEVEPPGPRRDPNPDHGFLPSAGRIHPRLGGGHGLSHRWGPRRAAAPWGAGPGAGDRVRHTPIACGASVGPAESSATCRGPPARSAARDGARPAAGRGSPAARPGTGSGGSDSSFPPSPPLAPPLPPWSP